jgi:hypothetical protein
VDALLEANAVVHINHPRGARFENGELIVSSIYVGSSPISAVVMPAFCGTCGNTPKPN